MAYRAVGAGGVEVHVRVDPAQPAAELQGGELVVGALGHLRRQHLQGAGLGPGLLGVEVPQLGSRAKHDTRERVKQRGLLSEG